MPPLTSSRHSILFNYGAIMTKREIAALACRLMAVYLIISGLSVFESSLIQFFYVFRPSSVPAFPGGGVALLYLAPCVIYVIVAFALWTGADILAALMVKGDDFDAGQPVAAPDLQAVAFSVVGLYLAVQALPRLVQHVGNLMWNDNIASSATTRVGEATSFSLILSILVQFVLGVWLLCRTPQVLAFAGTFQRRRYQPTTHYDYETEASPPEQDEPAPPSPSM